MKFKSVLAGIAALLLIPAAAQASPQITISSPAAITYQQNQSVTAVYSCTDSQRRRRIVSCNGTVPNGSAVNTSTNGSFVFTVNATNDRGQSATKSLTYTVGTSGGGGGGSCSNGYVALTYDDGPTSMTTQYVDTLAANGAKATFFLVGNQQSAFPNGASYEVSKGNYLADHTMSHPHLTTLSTSQWQFEIRQQQAITANIFGEYLFRPPYGESNGPIWDYSESLGMRETKWSLDTGDYNSPTTSSIVNNVVSNSHNQTIVLMHDGYPNTLAAIGPIVSGLRNKGLCPGRIIQSWDNPIYTAWGEPMYVNVVPF